MNIFCKWKTTSIYAQKLAIIFLHIICNTLSLLYFV